MWIKSFILASCLITALLAADEHRPKRKDDRGKRNLEYSISHHYSGPHSYRPERRISTGSLLYHNPPFFPGPRSYSSYRTGRPYSLPPPPYAVQMEPLIQYSQKDPLYDTNIFSLHTDDLNDLSTDTNHINEHIYGPPKPQIIERPVYIKEPEPIIEIIIKESNVTLPPIPTTPPPKKKKEEVQVFYVKYKKNPNGHGKDSVIYDKPVPAISPPIHDEEEKLEPEPHYHARESVTLPPPPSTTLRTIINPDSETYHSPSGIKVTFGKESFDYSKRQVNKFDKNGPQQIHFPQGRQLSPPSNFHKRAPGPSYNLQFNPNSYRPEPRQPQPYRPFNAPSNLQFKPSVPSNIRDTSGPGPQFTQSKPPFQSSPYSKLPSPQFSRPPPPFPSNGSPYPQFPTGALNPPPPTFQSPRPAVPYKPFEHLKPNTTPSPTFEPHQENFGAIQQPSFIKPSSFQPPQHLINQQPQFSQPLPTPQQQFSQPLPSPQQQHQFKPESHFPTQQQLPLAQQSHRFSSQAQVRPIQVPQPTQIVQPQQNFIQQQQQLQQQQLQQQQLQQQQLQQQQQQQIHQHQQQHQQQQHQQQQQQFAPNSQNEHLLNLQHAQNILPPGGELIQSLPKYEQHFSIIEPGNNQSPQSLALQQSQASTQNGQNNQNLAQQHNQNSFESQKYNQKIQEDLLHLQSRGNLNSQQQQQQQQQQTSNVQQQYYQQFNNQHQQNIYTTPKSAPVYKTSSSTPRVIYQSTTQPTTTTTEEPVTIPTTTKDPKILEAQLPDEVPEDLRAQLLSSGILNNADISILDYDKVGDIPLSALPPDQLANFYNAGGGAQIGSESKQIHAVLKVDGTKVENPPLDLDSAGSEITETKAKTGVEMKLVKYNPETDQGQKIQEAYIKDDATQVDPVVLNDDTYSRYLPLKVNGTQFPIPDVPELRGKQISSVVVLAPIAYDFSSQRKTRNVNASDELDLVQGEALKALLANPSLNNYKTFLDSQNRTKSEKQAVILLVIGDGKTKGENKEIYMYDIGTQSVSKLSGELSSAFVEAAEANAEKDAEDSKSAASNRIERRIHFEEETDRTSTIDQTDRKS